MLQNIFLPWNSGFAIFINALFVLIMVGVLLLLLIVFYVAHKKSTLRSKQPMTPSAFAEREAIIEYLLYAADHGSWSAFPGAALALRQMSDLIKGGAHLELRDMIKSIRNSKK